MGMDRAVNIACRGFSLVELLIALTVSGILLAMLSGMISQITSAGVLLDEESEKAKRQITLRRLFHRDVQNMVAPGSMVFEDNRVIFDTTHSKLLDAPFPVTVTWDFAKNRIVRSEEVEDLNYKREDVLSGGLSSWSFEAYDDKQSRWLNFNTLKAVSAKNKDMVNDLTAMRLKVGLGQVSVNTIERLPYAILLMQAE